MKGFKFHFLDFNKMPEEKKLDENYARIMSNFF